MRTPRVVIAVVLGLVSCGADPQRQQLQQRPAPEPSADADAAAVPFQRKKKTEVEPDSQQIIVYVTRTGKKYHLEGCRSLSKSKIPIELSKAVATYGPCGICKPPIPK